jgi:copper chaperone CopZ
MALLLNSAQGQVVLAESEPEKKANSALVVPVEGQGVDAQNPANVNTEVKELTPVLSSEVEKHKLSMQLSGSMCAVCLMNLERKLNDQNGVESAQVHVEKDYNFAFKYSAVGMKTAEAQLVYNAKVVDLDTIKLIISSMGFHAFNLKDRLL